MIRTYTKTKNGVAIFSFKNPYWVLFLIHKSVVTLSWIGITQKGLKSAFIVGAIHELPRAS